MEEEIAQSRITWKKRLRKPGLRRSVCVVGKGTVVNIKVFKCEGA